jgi:hypothetical protein
MRKTVFRCAILTAATVVAAVLPAVAAAEEVVPPGNSAATQYTETFPTAGGNAELGSNSTINGGGKGGNGALPTKTAHKLASQGRDGRAVADLAAEGAPPPAGTSGREPASGQRSTAAPGGGSGSPPASTGGAAAGSSSPGGSSEAAAAPGAGGQSLAARASAGSSGLGEVLGGATGSGAGEMGVFLPLILLAGLVWAIAFIWRRHRGDRAAASG